MENKIIDIIIPFKDREKWRIQKCLNYLKNNESLNINSIIVVDYNSEKDTKFKGCEVLKIRNGTEFNKAHALNLGILKAKSEYIMTLDADILLSKEHFKKIADKLDENSFIIDTNVRRIKKEELEEDYVASCKKSHPWHKNDRNQMFNQANGGFQVYSRKFYTDIGGIMESMGIYMGAMDNYTFYLARLRGLEVTDLSIPLLHLEHKKQKNQSFDLTKEEQELARGYTQYKALYLDEMVKRKVTKNEEPIYGKEVPCNALFKQFENQYKNRDKIIQEAIKAGMKEIVICGQKFSIENAKPSVLISVVNNTGSMPDFFVWDLFKLYEFTRKVYPDLSIQQVNACNIDTMRNLSVKFACGDNPEKKVFDYVVMLDDDHSYKEDMIVKFLEIMQEKKIDILAPLTSGKRKPYRNTQYLKFLDPINVEGNSLSSKKQGLVQVEASGPVGMIMNTKIFKQMKFPFYNTEYWTNEQGDHLLGSDLSFCKKLLPLNIPIWINTDYCCPHWKILPLARDEIVQV